MTGRMPQPGDRVRVSFEGEYVRKADGDHHIVKADHDWCHETPNGAVVEVLEPADDPSKSPIGEVRRSSTAAVTVIKVGDTVATRWQAVETDASLGNEFVAGWEVIGAVPGTPAAEQNPVPPPVLARVRELLTNGQRIRAIKAIREAAVGLGLKEAKAFAETLPEWAVAERVNNERLLKRAVTAPRPEGQLNDDRFGRPNNDLGSKQ